LNDPIVLSGIQDGVSANAISPDRKWIASAGSGSRDGTVRLWDMKKASLPTKPSFELNTQNLAVRSLAFRIVDFSLSGFSKTAIAKQQTNSDDKGSRECILGVVAY
jgi:WD40 repeat protein